MIRRAIVPASARHAAAMRLALATTSSDPVAFMKAIPRHVPGGTWIRPTRVSPIPRGRPSIVARRAQFAHRLAHFLDRRRKTIAASIVHTIVRLTKLTRHFGVGDLVVVKAHELTDDEMARLVDRVLEEMKRGEWEELAPDAIRILTAVADDGIHAAFSQIGFHPDAVLTDRVNEAAAEWATERGAELVGMRRLDDGTFVQNPNAEWRIDDATRSLLRGDVAAAIRGGLSSDELADRLADSYAFSADRAMTIARTELARADVQGNMIAYTASGVVMGKEWVLGSEHDDDDECDDAADLGVVDLDDDFGGAGDPPAHPNCVCDVLPVLIDEPAEASDGQAG